MGVIWKKVWGAKPQTFSSKKILKIIEPLLLYNLLNFNLPIAFYLQ